MKTNPPLLVATDGSPSSLGALRVARALAELQGCPLVVLAVVEPVTIQGTAFVDPLLMIPAELTESLSSLLRSTVETQLEEVGLAGDAAALEIAVGPPAPTIVQVAVERNARLMVVGLGRRSSTDRWLGTETALRVVQLAHVPVLAVRTDATALPNRALVAVDFSVFSRDAAHAAADLLPAHAELHLAHVAWNAPVPELASKLAWLETYRIGARTRLDELRRELAGPRPVRAFTTILEGETARALLKYAAMSGADLIATGSHGYGFLGRIMMGSVSTRLLRQAPCSVLVAPPRGIVAEMPAGTQPARSQPRPAGTAEDRAPEDGRAIMSPAEASRS